MIEHTEESDQQPDWLTKMNHSMRSRRSLTPEPETIAVASTMTESTVLRASSEPPVHQYSSSEDESTKVSRCEEEPMFQPTKEAIRSHLRKLATLNEAGQETERLGIRDWGKPFVTQPKMCATRPCKGPTRTPTKKPKERDHSEAAVQLEVDAISNSRTLPTISSAPIAVPASSTGPPSDAQPPPPRSSGARSSSNRPSGSDTNIPSSL